MSNDVKNVSVRFPIDIHARIAASADAHRRSFNAEVLVLTEEALAARACDSPTPQRDCPPRP